MLQAGGNDILNSVGEAWYQVSSSIVEASDGVDIILDKEAPKKSPEPVPPAASMTSSPASLPQSPDRNMSNWQVYAADEDVITRNCLDAFLKILQGGDLTKFAYDVQSCDPALLVKVFIDILKKAKNNEFSELSWEVYYRLLYVLDALAEDQNDEWFACLSDVLESPEGDELRELLIPLTSGALILKKTTAKLLHTRIGNFGRDSLQHLFPINRPPLSGDDMLLDLD